MITMQEALNRLGGAPDEPMLEFYIARSWVRPAWNAEDWAFEEIDVARARLVHHLHRDLAVGTEAMDIVLHLLDQLYGTREQMRHLRGAVERQSEDIKRKILAVLEGSTA